MPRGAAAAPARAPAEAPLVRNVRIDEASAGQRLDNYLARLLKGVPRSRLYRLIRDGQVRVNGHRSDAGTRLVAGDEVRIPPVRTAAAPPRARPLMPAELPVLYEDDAILVVDKPAGMAVHGGSGVSFGAIERLRAARPSAPMLELVHRLDRDTSGVLMLAKKRSALTALHSAWGDGTVRKRYLALVKGQLPPGQRSVEVPLRKHVGAEGERRVSVDRAGVRARTLVTTLSACPRATLVEAELDTGRTHQIRVHLAHIGHPILGDSKYGDFALNKELSRAGLRRMFLHAAELTLDHPLTAEPLRLRSALPPELETVRRKLFHPIEHAGAV